MAARKQNGDLCPGFGLPLKWQQEDGQTRHGHNTFLNSALDGSEEGGEAFAPLTVGERRMLVCMSNLTNTPEWCEKVLSDDFMERWKSKMLSEDAKLSSEMVHWVFICLHELREIVSFHDRTRLIPALNHGVFVSDQLLPGPIGTALDVQLKSIETVKTGNQHRRVQSHVIDPSLYPLCFGKTKYISPRKLYLEDCIRNCPKGTTGTFLMSKENGSLNGRDAFMIDNAWSTQFQWLPCEVEFDNETEKPRITSYINNVHPLLHRKFYSLVNEILSSLVPMFNATLKSVKTPGLYARRIDPEQRQNRNTWPDPEPGPYRPWASRVQSRYLNKDGSLKDSVQVNLQKEFWDVGIQVIIQEFGMELDFQASEFAGEDWHVQGQLNERICATAIYCYSCSNVPPVSISFRNRCCNDEAISLNCLATRTKDTEEVYGIVDLGPAVQELGDVLVREGRLITFPNTLQMKLNPFRLLDPSRRGECRLLIVHLVDPNRRIMSTAHVPPQQRDWWAREVRLRTPVFWRLPVEIFDNIIEMVDGYPISTQEAEDFKEEFLRERAEFTRTHTAAMFGHKFDLMTEARRHETEMGYHER